MQNHARLRWWYIYKHYREKSNHRFQSTQFQLEPKDTVSMYVFKICGMSKNFFISAVHVRHSCLHGQRSSEKPPYQKHRILQQSRIKEVSALCWGGCKRERPTVLNIMHGDHTRDPLDPGGCNKAPSMGVPISIQKPTLVNAKPMRSLEWSEWEATSLDLIGWSVLTPVDQIVYSVVL